MVARIEVALPTACLGTVRKAFFLIRVQDSWSASRTKTPGSSSPLPKTTSPRLFQALFSFLRSPSFFRFFQLFKYQGQSISPPHAFFLLGPYESILEPQRIRAHWRIIRQSSSPLVSSQTSRFPTHAPTAEPLRPTVVVLPTLRTIRHCVCKVTVNCIGSDLVHSRIARLLFA
ncbi:uncharacterized protein TNCV_3245261 [Trichonephila clavipes]|nr:uncharacterized protein TNCV_3245261 [Trichonephila clavipes]